MQVRIVGVAGGSCSGKTSLVRMAAEHFGPAQCTVVQQDNYYYDRPEAVDGKLKFNFDHPDAIDFGMLCGHLAELRAGIAVDTPVYDFARHVRLDATLTRTEPRPLVLVDGILLLTQPRLLEYLDFSVFVECSDDLRLERRIARDVAERGRTRENVIAQFTQQVRPMHDAFVEPSKAGASLVLSQTQFIREMAGETARFLGACRRLLKPQ